MNTTTISSQRHIDEEIVAAKSDARDYAVSYVNVTVEGVDYRVIVDGHHSYSAAIADGASVVWEHASTIQQDVDALGSIGWLEANQHDSDWYDVATCVNVWQ
jgi:hypothetical protein